LMPREKTMLLLPLSWRPGRMLGLDRGSLDCSRSLAGVGRRRRVWWRWPKFGLHYLYRNYIQFTIFFVGTVADLGFYLRVCH
jgi:hypothetical protein